VSSGDPIWIDQDEIKNKIANFFDEKNSDLNKFGQTVNQVFEVFVLMSVVTWYRERGWDIETVNGDKEKRVKLKFSTRGRPNGYTYFVCKKDGETCQVRHQIRVATKSYRKGEVPFANVCLDVAVIKDMDLSKFKSDDFVPNAKLITFGEAKHRRAFAELLVNFVGMVHELSPKRLRKLRPMEVPSNHLPPFLYVSGPLGSTSQGIKKTIEDRGFDIDIYWRTGILVKSVKLPVKENPHRSRGSRATGA